MVSRTSMESRRCVFSSETMEGMGTLMINPVQRRRTKKQLRAVDPPTEPIQAGNAV